MAGIAVRTRPGWAMLQVLGSLFISASVLGICVPLFIEAQRQAEAGILRARMNDSTRQIAAHLREEIRQAARVEVGEGGMSLRLTLPRVTAPGILDSVDYRQTDEGLLRTFRPGDAARQPEQTLFARPRAEARFRVDGPGVAAKLTVRERIHGRRRQVELECSAMPRITP